MAYCSELAYDLDLAAVYYRRALTLRPDIGKLHNNLGNVLRDQGRLNEAIDCFRKAVELDPDRVVFNDNLIFSLRYCPGITLSELREASAVYDRLHASKYRDQWMPFAIDLDPDRVLRIGFVSADLGNHPVGYAIWPVLQHMDRHSCTTVCYSSRTNAGELSADPTMKCDIWRDVSKLSLDELANLIRNDRIDILIDLSGHSGGNRLMTFARKPAPIQASWLGGVGPTGMSAIEYFIADQALVSDDLVDEYHEHVIRLPTSWCFKPPQNAPEVGPLPALRSGFVTLGCFNNLAKVNPLVVETWSKIMKRIPNSRLAMKYRGLTNPSVTDYYRNLFEIEGINASRIDFQGESLFVEMLEIYNNQVDIALDPFPFNGGMTTMLALYMGVPVVTVPGETVASRKSLAVLSALGMTETVARDLDDYVQIAVGLANDLPRLAKMRAELRPRCLASPLFDGPTFAKDFMEQMRKVWREWVGRNHG